MFWRLKTRWATDIWKFLGAIDVEREANQFCIVRITNSEFPCVNTTWRSKDTVWWREGQTESLISSSSFIPGCVTKNKYQQLSNPSFETKVPKEKEEVKPDTVSSRFKIWTCQCQWLCRPVHVQRTTKGPPSCKKSKGFNSSVAMTATTRMTCRSY